MVVNDGSGLFVFSDDASPDEISAHSGKRAIVWIGSQPRRTIAIPYDEVGLVTGDVDLSVGSVAARVANGSRVSQQGEGAPIVIEGGGSQFTIETAGPRAGIVSFEATRASADLDLSIRYFYAKADNAFAGFRFRILSAPATDETLRVEVSLDPNRLTDPERTFLRTEAGASYRSTLLTPAGEAITLASPDGKITSAMAYDPVLKALYETPSGTWLIVTDAGSESVLLGLSGAESGSVPKGSGIAFKAGQPAFARSFGKPSSGTDFPLVSNPDGSPQPVTTAWMSFDIRGATGFYQSAPATAPLFTIGIRPGEEILRPFDTFPVVAFDSKVAAPVFPAVPYAGYFAADGDASTNALLEQFEHELLAPARTRTVLDPNDGPKGIDDSETSAAAETRVQATTPQGLYSQFSDKGDWKVMDIAQTVLQRGFPLEINAIMRPLRDALFANQLFLVISSAEQFTRMTSTAYLLTDEIAATLVAKKAVAPGSKDAVRPLFGTLFETRADFEPQLRSALQNFPNDVEAYLAASQFAQLNAGGWKFNLAPATWNAGTMLIVKASDQSFPSMAANLAGWTLPKALNSDPAATQKTLLDFIAAARADRPNNPDLAYFVETVLAEQSATTSVWNGILYLNVSVPASALPSQLRGLVSGFPPDALIPAHHLGINTSSFRLFQGRIVPGNSSVFGLVIYQADDKLRRPAPYDFRVLFLRAEVVNSVLVSFSSEIELEINQLFGETARLQPRAPGNRNAIVLTGQLQQHGSDSSFSFTFKGSNRFEVDSAIVSSVTITNAEFVTLGATGQPADQTPPITSSQFVLSGDLEFEKAAGFDPLSFGGDGTSLAFDNLLITINQPIGDKASFVFDASQVTFDDATSLARTGSLFQQFPLALDGMRQGENESGRPPVTPETLGYLPVRSPASSPEKPAPPPVWFGLLYELSLGSAGALAPLLNFNSSLLVTWSPGAETLSLFLKIPASGGSNSITIEGPISLALNDLAFEYDETNGDYLLLFTNPLFIYLGVGFFGLSSDLTVLLFGSPPDSGTKTLGWYSTDQNQKAGPVKVDFFGLSQNLVPRAAGSDATSVSAVLELLKKTFFPPASKDKNPLPSLPALKFSGTGNWMIGLEATLFSTLSLGIVFADPRFYGLHIGLAGEKAGKLDGLGFDVLYSKVTDTIGVYHIALELPAAYREFKFGQLGITAPVVVVDVFSNGDYRVDVGFPDGLDFSNSFSINAGLLTGSGGFFFGRYSAANSPIVQPTNGTFDPIIELGIAISVAREFAYPQKPAKKDGQKTDPGQDKQLQKKEKAPKKPAGPISGKAGIALIGIVQGVFAPFNPTDNAVSSGLYHRITGTLALTGEIEGNIDLKIIKISISASATAQGTITFEAGEPTEVEISISFQVSAKLTILFFTISISFKASASLSFTLLPSLFTPPWILPETSDEIVNQLTLRGQRPRYRRRRLTQADFESVAAGQPDFKPVAVFGGAKKQLPIGIMPALTVGIPPGTSSPSAQQVVMLLMAQNSVPPAARNAAEATSAVMPNAATAPFNELVSAMLLWSIAAQTGRDPNGGTVSASELQAIANYLSDPKNRDAAFPYQRVSDFLDLNLRLQVSLPMNDAGAAIDLRDGSLLEEGQTLPATIFPMAPPLTMTPKGLPARDFFTEPAVTDDYVAAFQKFFDELEAQARDSAGGPRGLQEEVQGGAMQSFARLIFADYFGLLASEATRAAAGILAGFPFQPTGASGFNGGPKETLTSISELFPGTTAEFRTRTGDTLVSVAAALRVPVAELMEGNAWLRARAAAEPLPPNSSIVARVGPTVIAIAENNPSYPLAAKFPVEIAFEELPHQIRSGDTLASIAADFGIAPPALFPEGGNNQTNDALLIAGRTLVVPGKAKYTTKEGDCFLSIAKELDPGDPQSLLRGIVTANAGDATILRPLAILLRPPFNYRIVEGDSLNTVAAKFDLTIDELARMTSNTAGLLSRYDPKEGYLAVPNVASRTTAALIDDLIRTGAYNNLAGMASRLLLDGLRVPLRDSKGGADFSRLTPLYDMLGQQFPAPPPSGATYPVAIENSGRVEWLSLVSDSKSVPKFDVPLGPGFFANSPLSVLEPQIFSGPSATPLFQDVPPRYPLPRNIQWQNAERIPLPGDSKAAGLSLWPFSDALLNTAAAGTNGDFRLVAIGATGGVAPLETYAWTTAIPIRLRQAPSVAGTPLTNSYVVLGTGQSTRNLLRLATEFAFRNKTTLQLLHAPAGGGANSSGLLSDVLDGSSTFVLKTNLTKVTSSGVALQGDETPDSYARVTDTGNFLRLLWQASVTGSGGFYLNYRTNTGQGLPPSAFSGGEADLWLVLLADAQSRPSNPDRKLLPFNNCAVLVGNPDPATGALAVDEPKGTLQRQPVTAPGTIGFALARTDPTEAPGATGQTQRLYSLLSYSVDRNSFFRGSNQALPSGPMEGPPVADGQWYYRETIPIARFGETNDAPQSVALPPADANPYRGIAGQKLSEAVVAMNFHDVYGNTTTINPPLGKLTLPVGYTDVLMPVSAWPAASFGYVFDSGITLRTTLSLDATRFLPGAGDDAEQSQASAVAAAQQYASIFYQVQQRDLGFTITSNVGRTEIAADELKASIQAFVSKATVFADAAASLTGVFAPTSAIPFGDFAKELSLPPGVIVSANAGRLVSDIFNGPVINPQFVVAATGNTLTMLAGQLAPGVTPALPKTCPPDSPACQTFSRMRMVEEGESAGFEATAPAPHEAMAGLTPAAVAVMNPTQPLTAGIVIGVKEQSVAAERMTLNAIALEAATTVYTDFPGPDGKALVIGLYASNKDVAGIIEPQTITLKRKSVPSDARTTLGGLFNDFKELYKDEKAFAADIATIPALFVTSARILFNSFVVPADKPFSFSQLKSNAGTIEAAGAFNARVANLFVTGSPIYLGYRCCKPKESDSIEEFANWAEITVDQFGSVNAVTPLNAGKQLDVPGVVRFDPARTLYSAYSPKPNDSLQSIIDIFTPGDPQKVADINRHLPGIFRAGASFDLLGRRITPAPLDSLETAFVSSGAATYPDFAKALAPIASIYRTSGVVIAPMATSRGAALNALALRVNVAPSALLTANASLRGLLNEGKMIAASGESLTIGSYDTVNTIIARFAESGLPVTIDDLVAANGDKADLLSPSQPFLLPPKPTQIDIPFNESVPPPGQKIEDGIVFPVGVTVGIDRSPLLVHPQFANVENIRSTSSDVAPIATLTAGGYTLEAFAESFEKAFAASRLKCAISRGSGNTTTGSEKIFAVNFGDKGIRSLKVGADKPQFYSLAPLSTSLVAGPATFRPYVSGCGLCQKQVTKNFDSVDLDNWMQQLLATIDLALTAPYAVAGFVTDSRTSSAPAPPAAPLQDGPVGFGPRPEQFDVATCAGCGKETAIGATGFSDLVLAKGQLARGLRENIQPILKSGTNSGFAFENGKDTLFQQTLARLADAYTVDAVVQFPVEVSSPFPTGVSGIFPPRAAGKVEPLQYRIPASGGTSLNDVAAVFGIAPAYLAEVLFDVPGIVRGDVTVSFGGKPPYTTLENDTIRVIATALGVKPPDEAWTEWVAFIEEPGGIGATSLFFDSATFPLTPVARRMKESDSLDTFAAFIDRGVVNVGRGSQNLPGIFKEGSTIRLNGYKPYSVGKGDTLRRIAQALQPAGPGFTPLTVDDLTAGIAGVTGLFVADEKLNTAIVQPDLTFSTSKIVLGPGGESNEAVPELTFLLTTSQPARQRNVFLNLHYTINQLEYAISNLPGGYQASSWLTFVLPIGSGRGLDDRDIVTDMPQTQVPIPLRAYPANPLLIAQNGAASKPGSSKLAEVKQWTYDFDVRTDLASQDTAHLQVIFTQGSLPPESSAGLSAADFPSLYATLAGFIDAYPQLRNDLALLTTSSGGTNATAAYALRALADIALGVAKALNAKPKDAFDSGVPLEIYRYAISTTVNAGNELDELRLRIEEQPKESEPMYPAVLLNGKPLESKADGVYQYPPGLDPAKPLTQRYRFADRDVIRNKNAYGGISVTRNDNLIAYGPIGAGPTGATPMPTNERFIYSTDQVNFVDGLTPFIDRQSPLELDVRGSLEELIASALRQILDLEGQSPADPSLITLLASLGFPTATIGGEALQAVTPLRLVPQAVVGADNVQSYANTLASSIRDVLGKEPRRAGSALVVDLTVFSVTPPRGPTSDLGPRGATAIDPLKPVFRLRDLELPLPPSLDAPGPAGISEQKKLE
jgi:hypothetical protein